MCVCACVWYNLPSSDDLPLMQWFLDHPEFGSNSFYVGGGSYSTMPAVPLVNKLYEGWISVVF